MNNKERFINTYEKLIKRDGSAELLKYLLSNSSDFFTAPASTKYHGAYEGGLLEHSLNVYDCLVDYLSRERVKDTYKLNYSEETVAIVALLHDLCKINCYVVGSRNVKDSDGTWHSVPTYYFDDTLPYGHGEKSVYIISAYMHLTHEEAFAIRYHMGFSNDEEERMVGKAFEMYPLAFVLSTTDMEATYFVEKQ